MKKTNRFYASLQVLSNHMLRAAKILHNPAAEYGGPGIHADTTQNYDQLLAELSDAFITPIDREDLLLCAQSLYTLEHALNTLHTYPIYYIKPRHSELIAAICGSLQRAVHALGNKPAPLLSLLCESRKHIEHAKQECLRDYQDLLRLKNHSSYRMVEIQFQFLNIFEVLSLCLNTMHALEMIVIKNI